MVLIAKASPQRTFASMHDCTLLNSKRKAGLFSCISCWVFFVAAGGRAVRKKNPILGRIVFSESNVVQQYLSGERPAVLAGSCLHAVWPVFQNLPGRER